MINVGLFLGLFLNAYYLTLTPFLFFFFFLWFDLLFCLVYAGFEADRTKLSSQNNGSELHMAAVAESRTVLSVLNNTSRMNILLSPCVVLSRCLGIFLYSECEFSGTFFAKRCSLSKLQGGEHKAPWSVPEGSLKAGSSGTDMNACVILLISICGDTN